MAVPTQLTQYDPNLNNLQQAATSAGSSAVDYQSEENLLPSKLKQAIMDKLNYNQDIISQQNQAQANYFAEPAQARQQYANIFNPFEREALVSQATSNAYAPYATLSNILAQRQGSISDAITAGTNAFQAESTSQQGKAQLAQQAFQDAMTNAQWLYSIAHPGGTTGASQNVMQQIQQDAKNYTNLDTLMQKYGTSPYVTPDDILRLYNTNSPYGVAKETSAELQQKYGVSPAKGTTKWQLKKSTLVPANKGLFSTGLFGSPAKIQTSLYDPDTGRQIVPDANGNIHVTDKKTGQTGYIPIDEFDSNKYEPVGD